MKQVATLLFVAMAIFAAALLVFPFPAVAGNYPPSNIEEITSIEDSTDVHFPISFIRIFVYDSLYQSERTADGQVVKGTVLMYQDDEESEILRFDLYGSPNPLPKKKGTSDYYGFFNRVVIIPVWGSSEVVVRQEDQYGAGFREGKTACERVLYIKLDFGTSSQYVTSYPPYVTDLTE
ncbi:MAG: hypothetical protein WC289_06135 [Patescibacteria group bacterium]|jgi:hypothetical protein